MERMARKRTGKKGLYQKWNCRLASRENRQVMPRWACSGTCPDRRKSDELASAAAVLSAGVCGPTWSRRPNQRMQLCRGHSTQRLNRRRFLTWHRSGLRAISGLLLAARSSASGSVSLLGCRFCAGKTVLQEFDLAVVVGFVFGNVKPFGVVVRREVTHSNQRR